MSTNSKLTAGLLAIVLLGLVALVVFVQHADKGSGSGAATWSQPTATG